MSYFCGTFVAPNSTGDFTISSLPFTPTHAKFTCAGKTTNSATEARTGVGVTDGTNNFATATICNSNGFFTRKYTDACVIALSTPSGSIDEAVKADLVEFPTNACKLDFSITNNSYFFIAEFWDD